MKYHVRILISGGRGKEEKAWQLGSLNLHIFILTDHMATRWILDLYVLFGCLRGPFVFVELQANAVHAVSLVSRCTVPFALEDVTQVASAIRAHNFRSTDTKRSIFKTFDCAGDAIKVCWPPAA